MAAVFLINSFAPNKIVKRNLVIICKLYRSPQGKLALSALVALINRDLHIEILGDILLSLIVILAKIANSSINKHSLHNDSSFIHHLI